MQENYYKALLEKEKDTRHFRHDFNNHILYLEEILESGYIDKALEYNRNLGSKAEIIYRECYYTGNKILDLILNFYFSNLEDTNIKIHGICERDIDIDDVGMCIIFSNVIQNTAEAVQRQNDKNKQAQKRHLLQGTRI